jgi:hypothetical protein
MNYKNKYLKYKNKYIELKKKNNNIGVMPIEQIELKKKIFDDETNKVKSHARERDIGDYYNLYLSNNRICEAINYIKKNRKMGKKIMLVVGAIPEQSNKFVIPDDYVTIYSQNNFHLEDYFSLTNYLETKINSISNLFTKCFEEYPILYNDVFDIKKLESQFDFVVFDKGTCFWIGFDKNILLKIFKYTYDNSSIVVIDNLSNAIPYNNSTVIPTNDVMSVKMPMYYSNTTHFNIYTQNNKWFNENFGIGNYMRNKLLTDVSNPYYLEKLKLELGTKYTAILVT